MPTNVESEEIPGLSQALVDRYELPGLIRIIQRTSGHSYAFIYDRGNQGVFDGTNCTAPLACNRHTYDYVTAHWRWAEHVDRGEGWSDEAFENFRPRRGWLAVQLLEEHCSPDGGKWREVAILRPSELLVGGSPLVS